MFDFLLTASHCAMWLHKLMSYIYLKTPNSCDFSFFNRHIFGQQTHFHSIGSFSINRHFFIIRHFHSIDTFSANMHLFNQWALVYMSNTKKLCLFIWWNKRNVLVIFSQYFVSWVGWQLPINKQTLLSLSPYFLVLRPDSKFLKKT